jgi:CO/xanthine dehydrogenase Mo-binding subunit
MMTRRLAVLLAALFAPTVFAQGMLLPTDPSMGPLGIKYQRVSAEIVDGAAVTRVEQVFVNSSNRQLEAHYVFPLPKGAALQDFYLWINGKRTKGEVLEKLKELSAWKGARPGPGLGRGVAFVHAHGVPVAEIVDVRVVDGAIKLEQVFLVVDDGTVLDPVNFEAQMFGACIFGLGHAMNCELTYENFMPTQTNFHQHEAMRLHQTPKFVMASLQNNPKIRGMGEPCLPPASPALANAIYAATGTRVRALPFNKSVRFV